jgi:hypothetical protein
MIEYSGYALCGLIVFGLGLLKSSPIRAGERSAELVLAIISGIALLFILASAFEPVAGGPDDAIARLAALWVGALAATSSIGCCRSALQSRPACRLNTMRQPAG